MNTLNKEVGTFVISLDFELFWGVWDVSTKESYGKNIIGVKEVIPKLLEIFKEFDINVTFSTVGFLFAKDAKELHSYIPKNTPNYSQKTFNVYDKEISLIGDDETNDPYHFGYNLLQKIKESNHEIGTHTFSHYYCLEDGQTIKNFEDDIVASKKIAENFGVNLKSIVFPRNQINLKYLKMLKNEGIKSYRGNPQSWIYKPRKYGDESLIIRFFRLIDTYLPITGHNTYTVLNDENLPLNIPGSRFLKPYTKNLSFFDKLKIARITRAMKNAAKNNKTYHLWWHPHNFGVNVKENFEMLNKILESYKKLNLKYGFKSSTMQEIGDKLVYNN